MSRGSYLGGHTVLTQKPGDFYRQLAVDAAKAKKKAARAQRLIDQEHERNTKSLERMESEFRLQRLVNDRFRNLSQRPHSDGNPYGPVPAPKNAWRG